MPSDGDRYSRHFAETVVPHLRSIPGHHNAYLLRRESGNLSEFLAVTIWDSLDTVKRFTGPDPEVAIVDPEARTMLSAFDDFARHFEVAYPPDNT
jgi:heme-degrading monooxygenase HmoA